MTNTRRMQMATAGQSGADIFERYGSLWGSGQASAGVLGDNSTTSKSSPVQIKSDVDDWGEIYPVNDVTGGITNSGDIYTWGGAQPQATRAAGTSSPVLISSGSVGSGGWSAFSGGKESYIGVKDGKLYAWGKNSMGQLGQSNTTNKSSPIQIGGLTNWVSVGSSDRAHFAINSDGELFSWGYNSYGKLGHGDTTNRSSPVQVGSLTNWETVSHSYYCPSFLKTDGTLWSMGEGSSGSNGQNNTTTYSSPVQVGSATNWVKVGGGNQTTMALNSDNELWVCGRNDDGQLGLNISTATNKSVLTQISGAWLDFYCSQSCVSAVKTDGTLWGWGQNGYGEIGDGSTTKYSSPVQVGSLTDWIGVAGPGGLGSTHYFLKA